MELCSEVIVNVGPMRNIVESHRHLIAQGREGSTMSGHHESPMTPEEIAKVKDEDIDFSDIPELDEKFWERADLFEPDHADQRLVQGSRRVKQFPAVESSPSRSPHASPLTQARTDPADSSSCGRPS